MSLQFGIDTIQDGWLFESTAVWAEERTFPADNDYLLSIMKPVYEPGKFAGWIGPPRTGINRQPVDFEYVRFDKPRAGGMS